MIRLQCSCGHPVAVEESRAGRAVRCPSCGGRVHIPSLDPPAREPDPAPPPLHDFDEELAAEERDAGPRGDASPPAPRPKKIPGPAAARARPAPRPRPPPSSPAPRGRDPLRAYDVALGVMVWVTLAGAVLVPAILLLPGEAGRAEVIASILALVGGVLIAFLLSFLRVLTRAVIALKRGQVEIARSLE